jgi:hypothetical protein
MPPTVAYSELPGSPTEQWTEEGFTATVKLMCAWGVRNTLATEIMTQREPYPRFPGTKAYPRVADIEPFPAKIDESAVAWGLLGSLSSFESALVTISYDTSGADVDLIDEVLEPTAEFMTLDHKDFRWGSGTGDELKEGEAPGKLIRGLDYRVTFHQAPYIPAAVLTLPGYCNEEALTSYTLGLTFPAQTLLFQPPTATRRITSQMVECWKLGYRFSYRATGWNKFWRQAADDWAEIWHAGGTRYYNYPLGDFPSAFPLLP